MAIIEHKKGRVKKKQVGFHEGQKVALLISARKEMGFIAVINGTHAGILYKNEVFQPLKRPPDPNEVVYSVGVRCRF